MDQMNWLTSERAMSAIRIAWLTLIFFWIWMSRSVKRNEGRESIASSLRYSAVILLGFVTMFVPLGDALGRRVLPPSPGLSLIAVALNWAGVLFAIWARIYLGRNWSATVALKHEHELVRTGPYRLMRHPIYSGMLLACIGIAVEVDRWQALIGLAFAFIGFRFKSRIEERLMVKRFGRQYEDYRRTTNALFPHISLTHSV